MSVVVWYARSPPSVPELGTLARTGPCGDSEGSRLCGVELLAIDQRLAADDDDLPEAVGTHVAVAPCRARDMLVHTVGASSWVGL